MKGSTCQSIILAGVFQCPSLGQCLGQDLFTYSQLDFIIGLQNPYLIWPLILYIHFFHPNTLLMLIKFIMNYQLQFFIFIFMPINTFFVSIWGFFVVILCCFFFVCFLVLHLFSTTFLFSSQNKMYFTKPSHFIDSFKS